MTTTERIERISNAITSILDVLEVEEQEVKENTPKRVAEAYMEMLSGYQDNPEQILGKQFIESISGMLVQGPISFTSLCKHHLLPFEGVAFLSYIAKGGKVVGLSKLSRLTYCFARRLQLQELMTAQIADSIEKYLSPDVAVLTISTHGCMKCRGVLNHSPSSWAELRGAYYVQAKEEFFKRVELNWKFSDRG